MRKPIHDFDMTEAIVIPAQKRKSKLISIRLPLDMFQALRDISRKHRDIGYQKIIKQYIQQGLENEQRSVFRFKNRQRGDTFLRGALVARLDAAEELANYASHE